MKFACLVLAPGYDLTGNEVWAIAIIALAAICICYKLCFHYEQMREYDLLEKGVSVEAIQGTWPSAAWKRLSNREEQP